MRRTRIQKGITLIALIITIIILLILAVVTIGSIENSQIITYAQKSAKTYKESAQKEKILLDLQFKTDANGNRFSSEDTDKIIDASNRTEVDASKLTTYYDLHYKRSFVVYRYDLVTEEERRELEKNGIKMLKGDVDFDGDLDSDDLKIISSSLEGMSLDESQKVVANMDNIEEINVLDLNYLSRVLSGVQKLYEDWMKWEVSKKTGVSENKLVEYYDECTKKYYVLYRYDLITEEERNKLEENGIKMLKGDLDFDGDIDESDVQILSGYTDGTGVTLTDIQKVVADMNNTETVDASDTTYLTKVESGIDPLYTEWEN